MITWKTKLFGDNRFNFYGWIGAGLLVCGASLWFLLKAFRAGAGHSPEGLLLLAIYIVLLGHFGLAAQNYCARVAREIEAQEDSRNQPQPTQKVAPPGGGSARAFCNPGITEGPPSVS